MRIRSKIAAGVICALVLSYTLVTIRECADHNRLKLFSESIRIGMPKKEVTAFTNAYAVWFDPDLPEEDFIYEVDNTMESDSWHFVKYSRARETPLGTYSEIYNLKIKLEGNRVSAKKYWKKKCFASPEWAKPRIHFAKCF